MKKMPGEAVENKPYFRLVATACLKFWILTIERVLHNQSDSKEKRPALTPAFLATSWKSVKSWP
jgi:hypothetical protein